MIKLVYLPLTAALFSPYLIQFIKLTYKPPTLDPNSHQTDSQTRNLFSYFSHQASP